MEAEERRPSVQVIEQLAEIFDISPNERTSFINFARGDWQSLVESKPINRPWHLQKVDRSSNLPASFTSFVGREKEQEQIIKLLKNNRIVTIAGAGGIGKTRLAIQVGNQILHEYLDGVWFVPLDSLLDPLLVPQTVASLFDIRESSNRPITETLQMILRGKSTMLILDNCEHLLDACAELILSLLIACPKLKILTTSREILNMEGEAIFHLSSLSIPESSAHIEKLEKYESIQLFVERAKLALSTFRFTRENAHPIVDICRQVDGIPLAIELTAACINILKVEEISNQLHKSFAGLAVDRRATIPRHQTLQASLDWSWSLLTNSEQVFMRQLAVFAGGWTLEAAQAICDGKALTLTSALVNKSLILANQNSDHQTRYRFHEIVHQYAHEKIIKAGDEENVRTRHFNYFLKLSEQAESAWRGPAQVEWMERITDEWDNIRAALTWADKTHVEGGLYLASRLGRFWQSLNMREGSYWLTTFLQKPESHSHPKARAMALHAHLPVLNLMNQLDTWESTAKECIELYRLLGNQRGEIEVSLIMARNISSAAQRMEFFQEAINLAQISGDIWWQARTLWEVGWNCTGNERFNCWQQAIRLFRQAEDWRMLAQCLTSTANHALLNDNLKLAQKCLEEAILLNDQLKDKDTTTDLLNARAQMAMLRGNYNQARIYWQEELGISEELGARMDTLWCQSHLGYLALYEGNLTEASDIFLETAREFFNDKNRVGVVFNLEGIASLYVAIGKPEFAARLIGWADATRKNIDDPRPLLEQADVDKIIVACLAKMGEAAFSDAYETGKIMSLEEALEYALEEN